MVAFFPKYGCILDVDTCRLNLVAKDVKRLNGAMKWGVCFFLHITAKGITETFRKSFNIYLFIFFFSPKKENKC